jgi:hypothetical protein
VGVRWRPDISPEIRPGRSDEGAQNLFGDSSGVSRSFLDSFFTVYTTNMQLSTGYSDLNKRLETQEESPPKAQSANLRLPRPFLGVPPSFPSEVCLTTFERIMLVVLAVEIRPISGVFLAESPFYPPKGGLTEVPNPLRPQPLHLI